MVEILGKLTRKLKAIMVLKVVYSLILIRLDAHDVLLFYQYHFLFSFYAFLEQLG